MKTYLREIRKAIKSQAASAPTRSDNSVVKASDNYVINGSDGSVVNALSRVDDNSVVNGGVEAKVHSGDNSVVSGVKLLDGEGDNFHRLLWKTLWKRGFSGPQTTEIHGLLALCTIFVQTSLTRSSSITAIITGLRLDFLSIFATSWPRVAKLLKSCAKLRRFPQ